MGSHRRGRDREAAIDLARGAMDRLRDHCRENFPEEWKRVDECKTEISTKIIKNGERVAYFRNIKSPKG